LIVNLRATRWHIRLESADDQNLTVVFPAHVISRISHTLFSILHLTSFQQYGIESRFGHRDSQVTEADGHRTLDDQPVKAHKSKMHEKDRNKTGRASMAPPSLDPLSKRACHDITEGAPQSIPGRNKSCSMTYPCEYQRPTSCSINQQGDD
jgi:hypothetical protein